MTDEERQRAWQEWVEERPAAVREVAERFPPFQPYRLRETGQIVRVVSFDEEESGAVSLTVSISPEDNPSRAMLFARAVFGIKPESLEPTP